MEMQDSRKGRGFAAIDWRRDGGDQGAASAHRYRRVGRSMKKRAEFFIQGRERLRKPYHYIASGLDNVFLTSGVSINETPYGTMVSIENLNGLHRAIGLHIVEKEE